MTCLPAGLLFFRYRRTLLTLSDQRSFAFFPAGSWLIVMLAGVNVVQADFVRLHNGDRLTGEVQRFSDAKLILKTSYAGRIEIDRDAVTLFRSDDPFEVEAESGRFYRGVIQKDEAQLRVDDERGQVTLPAASVISARRAKGGRPPGFWQRLDGSIGLGFNLNRGNSDLNQTSVDVEGRYRREKYELKGRATSIFSRQEEADAVSRQNARLRFDRFLGAKGFYFLLGRLERNDRQRLNLRTNGGGGFGWRAVQRKNTTFSFLGGFSFSNEQFQVSPSLIRAPRNSTGEFLSALEWAITFWERIDFTTELSFHPDLLRAGRYRIEYDSSVRIPLVSRLTWKLDLFDRFDSKPRFRDVQENDFGLVSSFAYDF